ncbi:MAG: D-alanyl-D-alanine carboxypeptidase [Alphaproteobacteria bacterium]|nr:D-alanyl-D-alanine carboxypeptidase [Alphaproteobacteria bacterium]
MGETRRDFLRQLGVGVVAVGVAPVLFARSAQATPSTRMLSVVERGRKSSTLAIEAESGRILRARDSDVARIPASLVKPFGDMVIYDALRDGVIDPEDEITLTRTMTRIVDRQENGAHRFLRYHGFNTLSVDEALTLKIMQSMNEPALMLAALYEERTGKSFVEAMQDKADEIGCEHTVLRNPTGYYDSQQRTTPMDMCLMARHLINEYPDQYDRYGMTETEMRGRELRSFNRFLNMPEADGIKTGRLRSSGAHNLGSAVHDGHRVISIVMGAPTSSQAAMANRQLANLVFERHSVEWPGLESPVIPEPVETLPNYPPPVDGLDPFHPYRTSGMHCPPHDFRCDIP